MAGEVVSAFDSNKAMKFAYVPNEFKVDVNRKTHEVTSTDDKGGTTTGTENNPLFQDGVYLGNISFMIQAATFPT